MTGRRTPWCGWRPPLLEHFVTTTPTQFAAPAESASVLSRTTDVRDRPPSHRCVHAGARPPCCAGVAGGVGCVGGVGGGDPWNASAAAAPRTRTITRPRDARSSRRYESEPARVSPRPRVLGGPGYGCRRAASGSRVHSAINPHIESRVRNSAGISDALRYTSIPSSDPGGKSSTLPLG